MSIMILEMMGRANMTRAALGAAIVAVTLLAAGCVQKPVEKDDVAMATTTEQLRRAPTQPALRPTDPAAEEQPQKTATSASKQPDPVAMPPAEAAPVYSAAELVGKNKNEVAALIGDPTQVEQRAASTVWTYRGESCGLEVFFFLDMATSDERVLTVESRTELTEPATATDGAAAGATVAGTTAAPAATSTTETSIAPAPGQSTSDAGSVVDACYGKLRRS
jgi:hypothetical protein